MKNRLRPSKNNPLRVLGVMTGTSCDGLDAACIDICEDGWRPLWSESTNYPKKLRERVLKIQEPDSRITLADLLALDRDIGKWMGSFLNETIRHSTPSTRPHVIACHGQTVAHFPFLSGGGATLQIGNAAEVATATGLTTITQFRAGDLSAGGQGAPLAPLFHQILAKALSGNHGEIAIHNLGGISNLTYIGKNFKNTVAFDTGPANLWIDAAVEIYSRKKKTFDAGGLIALQGQPDEKAVKKILALPYFKKRAPKSTGRDDFSIRLLLSKTRARGVDLVATATEISARSIADSYQKEILRRGKKLSTIFFCGGGAKNETLLWRIQELLPDIQILTLDEAGFDSSLIEAQAFAVFGWLSLKGYPIGGAWTGAKKFGPPGMITPGENWSQVAALVSPK